jgi:hypothetical protein
VSGNDEKPVILNYADAGATNPKFDVLRLVRLLIMSGAIALVCLFLFSFLFFTILQWNYYEHYDRIKAVIESMPGVTIVDERFNRDLSLEDFGFQLRTDDGREVYILYSDHKPEMYEQNEYKIRAYVESRLATATHPVP